MSKLPQNPEYRAAFEAVVGLLKAAQERTLSCDESVQLNLHMATCRRFEEGLNQ
ncbi:hypothetical protein [Vibrio vulnificus]|uniref:hypothetical protein n=1 Tax=Vibrio vulnificus TaxID=672 RepID=UPI000A923E2C|nr:hypothetical protein [Vibrio vulnificus]MCJ0803039.1 hypothetical protein [Vibrio vulnificus]MDG3056144.1 hypothetical protein [Vibrio parahaemolyticus]